MLVEREDVLEAVGAFIAAYLASLPEAQGLQPAQLQAALKHAFQARRLRPLEQGADVCAWARLELSAQFMCISSMYVS